MSAQTQTVPPVSADFFPSQMFEKQIPHAGWEEIQATFRVPESGMAGDGKLNEFIDRKGSTLLNVDFFGDGEFLGKAHAGTPAKGTAPGTALVVRPGTPCGVQTGALRGLQPKPVFHDDRIVGHVFETADAKYCMLGDVRSSDPALSRSEQTAEVLQVMQETLSQAGMDFKNVVRTWFYIDHILDWYAAFNRVRTAFFKNNHIIRMPASTGIGISNFAGTAVIAKALAVLPKSNAVTIRQIDSPLQCEALAYGSAFSRAIEVADAKSRVLYVSGTASIEPGGDTAHIGNPATQIEKTMAVVRALLAQAKMDLSNTTRAIAYFKSSDYMPLWEEYCRRHQLPPMPVILAECDVCRDNLLFELELDAAVARE